MSTHRRSSYAIAVLVLAEPWRAADVFAEDVGRTPWLDWLAVAFSAYAFLSVLILLPFVQMRRARRPGADSWVMPVGFATAVVLLGITFLRKPPEAAA